MLGPWTVFLTVVHMAFFSAFIEQSSIPYPQLCGAVYNAVGVGLLCCELSSVKEPQPVLSVLLVELVGHFRSVFMTSAWRNIQRLILSTHQSVCVSG